MTELIKFMDSYREIINLIVNIGLIVFLPFVSIQISRGMRWLKDVNFRVIAINYAIREVLANGNKELYSNMYNEKYKELRENYKFIMKGE